MITLLLKVIAELKGILMFPWYRKIVTRKSKTVFDIDYDSLYEEGIRVLVFDVDQTLTGHKDEISEDIKDLLSSLLQKGFKIAIFSNCSRKRHNELQFMLNDLKVHIVIRSDKPRKGGYIEILDYFREVPEKATMIGDHIAIDLVGANSAKFRERIIVDEYSDHFGGSKAPVYQRLLKDFQKIFV